MSESDLSGRLPRPRIALERRPLLNSASTASCSMRFSLRRMTSGARCRISFCSRLFRLITRRYRSFKSEVAKRPPSSGTSGRRSGGITGTTSRIIHSGRLPEFLNAATTLRRFEIFFRRASLVASFISLRKSTNSLSMSSFFRSSRIASAPHPLVLPAVALVVLGGTEDLGAEESIPFGLEGAVVDRFRLLHLTMRPRSDLVGRGERDSNCVEDERIFRFFEETEEVFHHWAISPAGPSALL